MVRTRVKEARFRSLWRFAYGPVVVAISLVGRNSVRRKRIVACVRPYIGLGLVTLTPKIIVIIIRTVTGVARVYIIYYIYTRLYVYIMHMAVNPRAREREETRGFDSGRTGGCFPSVFPERVITGMLI